MSGTTGGPVNGEASGLDDLTGREVSLRSFPVTAIKRIEELTPRSEEKIEPADLYKFYSPVKGSFEIDAPIGKISLKLADVLATLRTAARETDELQRENHLAVATGRIYRLSALLGVFSGFDDALTVLLTAVHAHRTTVYSRADIVALERVLETIRRNPNSTDDEIIEISETLMTAGFDVNAPLADVEILVDEGDDR